MPDVDMAIDGSNKTLFALLYFIWWDETQVLAEIYAARFYRRRDTTRISKTVKKQMIKTDDINVSRYIIKSRRIEA